MLHANNIVYDNLLTFENICLLFFALQVNSFKQSWYFYSEIINDNVLLLLYFFILLFV